MFILQWLQSARQEELFDKYFSRISPDFVATINPMILLSVAAAVTSSFDTAVQERLGWLNAVLQSTNPRVSWFVSNTTLLY